MPFSKCLRAKIYSNMSVYFDTHGCQTLLLKESDPLLFSLGSWTKWRGLVDREPVKLLSNFIAGRPKAARFSWFFLLFYVLFVEMFVIKNNCFDVTANPNIKTKKIDKQSCVLFLV